MCLDSEHDSLAEWSKALASGASPQGRGFEPHSCHYVIWVCLICLQPWQNLNKRDCRDPGSNRGPSDLQSDALPAELSRPGEGVSVGILTQAKRCELARAPSRVYEIKVAAWKVAALAALRKGLLWELNPGPLAPEARIIALDQTAN